MVLNKGKSRILSSIGFETVTSQKEKNEKKHDFFTIFFIFRFLKLLKI